MARLFGAQRLVLQAIQDSPKDAAGFVTDAQVSQTTSIAPKDVRDWIDTLDGEGLVEVARTTEGLRASITARGRLHLRSPDSGGSAGRSSSPDFGRINSVLLSVPGILFICWTIFNFYCMIVYNAYFIFPVLSIANLIIWYWFIAPTIIVTAILALARKSEKFTYLIYITSVFLFILYLLIFHFGR